ncbi:MAG: MBL fold metallo-hydrolase [Clostridia bacterium]|nr:MBL fold metallo-hydrolase [Clostridia bacterium]
MKKAKVYTLFSSSKGNCSYIKYDRDEFLIDCGVSARAIECSLKQLGTSLSNIDAIFITHEHSDHIKGVGTISKYFKMPIYAPDKSCAHISQYMPNDKKPISLVSNTVVELKDTALCPIATPHDARGSVGFRIRVGDEKIGYFTDIGHLSEGVLRGLSGCRRVIIESNHDVEMLKSGPYPYPLKQRILGEFGHLSNTLCAKLLPHLVRYGCESFVLAHLSEENNRPEIAFNESLSSLNANGFCVNVENEEDSVRLDVAKVCGITELT